MELHYNSMCLECDKSNGRHRLVHSVGRGRGKSSAKPLWCTWLLLAADDVAVIVVVSGALIYTGQLARRAPHKQGDNSEQLRRRQTDNSCVQPCLAGTLLSGLPRFVLTFEL